MRVTNLKDFTPHEQLYEKLVAMGSPETIHNDQHGTFTINYYKRYKEADITPPDGLQMPYVEYSPEGQAESVLLHGTAAKILLMGELLAGLSYGNQLSLI